jgi:hypothetical protein
MKTYIRILASFGALLVIAAGALPATTITNLGTGQVPGTVGTASDPIWRIIGAPTGNTSGPAVLIGDPIWGAAPAGLHWIATDPSNAGGSQYAEGTYTYETTISCAYTCGLTFSIKADNAVDVLLNGNDIFSWGDPNGILSTGWATFSPVQTITTGFSAVNTLDLVVHNNGGYTGVLLEGEFTCAPEPASLFLMGSGILGVLAACRRRKKALNRFLPSLIQRSAGQMLRPGAEEVPSTRY